MSNTATQKDWSNPTPAGLVALAVACFCFFALLTGKVGVAALPLLGCWLLGGFVIQLVVALVDLKNGNTAGGNTFLFFCGFFMLAGGLEMLLKYNGITAGTPLEGLIDGYSWAVLAMVLILWTPAFLTKFTLLSIIIILVDMALPFIALVDLGVLPKGCLHISAWLLLLTGFVAIYLSAAMVVNTTYGRIVYPILGAPKS